MTTIGSFQVERELGRGGTGVVYLARDTRLDRLVAIKALPDALADEPDRLARFEREAKLVASLSHPGIAAVHGLQEHDGKHYLVMEYVEGETLAARLKRGRLPLEESLGIAVRTAEALEAAHEKGLIHRDLRPGNVMLTPEGAIKVLDFGLTRAADADSARVGSGSGSDPDSPAMTVTLPANAQTPTFPAVIPGATAYTSPEQASGKAVDKRSDIFSFGCVLYEMLTGVQVFSGDSAAALLAAITHVEPDWSRLPSATPTRIRELLASLLEKDRKQRLHDIGDARLELESAIRGREWVSQNAPGMGRRRKSIAASVSWLFAFASLGLAAVVLLSSGASSDTRRLASTRTPVRLRADLPEAPLTNVFDTGLLAVTADGSKLAYVSEKDGPRGSVVVRRMDDARVQRLTLSSRDMAPGLLPSDAMFSPNGSMVAGFSQSDLFITPVGGGEPTALYRGPSYVASKGGAWSDSGIIFCPAPNAGLLRISERGGEAETLTTPDAARDEISHRWPDFLPDGRHALMTVKTSGILTFDDAEIALLDMESRTWKTIIRGGSYARYVPTGHIVYARNGSIMAVGFDAATGRVTGTPAAVLSGVMTCPGSGAAQFAVAREAGSLFYIPGGPDQPQRELVWVDQKGTMEPVDAPVMYYRSAVFSPDGGRVAASVFGASDAIFVYDLARRTSTRMTYRGNCGGASWFPDGSKLAYASDADGAMSSYVADADGSGQPERVGNRGVNENTSLVMLDGRPALVLADAGDIWLQPFDGGPRRALVSSQFDETLPRVSPDGRWVSYASNESGQYEVFIRAFPTGSTRRQVSVGGGRVHCWAPAGDAVFYLRDSDNMLLRASVKISQAEEVGTPEPMFTWPASVVGGVEVSPRDGRFLGIRELPPKYEVSQVRVVLNWFDELRAKVPVETR